MIYNKRDLKFYIAADRIMNGFAEKPTIKELFINFLDRPVGGAIISYLSAMRHYAYYRNNYKRKISINSLKMAWWHRRWNIMGLKLGFSIGANTLGYGAVIPHHGPIIINSAVKIGNFSVLHTCTCIAGGDKTIGDYFYFSTGSQVVGKLTLGDGITIAAHSLVNKTSECNCLLAGAPAVVKRIDYPLWIENSKYKERVEKVNKIKKKIFNNV